ncbi:MAG: type II toxin-antitoxin system PrlF family antitoxin [Caldilineaceae bacterium]
MEEAVEYVATVTSKGQVTIPLAVREQLGIAPQDKVIFRIVEGNRLVVEPLPMTLEDVYGSVPPLQQPENFDELLETARDERAERYRQKLGV